MNKIKEYLIIFWVVITIALGLVTYFSLNKINKLQIDNTRLQNNYEAQVKETMIWKTHDSLNVATAQEFILTYKEALKSSDSKIQELIKTNKSLGNRLKNVEYALRIEADTVIDTVIKPVYIHTHDSVFIERDSLVIGKLTLRRDKVIGSDSAFYKIEYNPILSGFIHTHKEGKWKIKNIFIPREVNTYVDITSDDKLLNVKDVKLIKFKKKW